MTDTPGTRVSVEARERAMRELAEHMSSGRLTLAEFDERSAGVAAASTTEQLAGLFADLPGAPPPPAPLESFDPTRSFVLLGATGAVLVLVAALIFGGWLWLLAALLLLGGGAALVVWIKRSR
ncbi:DUF1707 SHOCT-like domain-containing protein [Nocardia donostiensis]|uniref:DUF1707 SHOCT-like domain-containing protein n=1 Tax=Nocardia donostiensis TaxID=1538463 RepID=UPI0015895F51|nr:DUF1707 domain-containing protein [Nocardia donostiensis]